MPRTILVLIFVGVLVFCWITDAPLGSASPIIAALIAGLVALSLTETVDSRRKTELLWKVREQREVVYRERGEHMLQSFGEGDFESVSRLLSDLALEAIVLAWK